MSRHFLSQGDVSRPEIECILQRAIELQRNPFQDHLRSRTLVMFFEKTSTRTRLSFEIGMTQLGGHAVYLDRDSSQLSRGESVRDTAGVLSRYADMLMARVFRHQTLEELAAHASIPVINGLSDREHPMQTMSDLMTIHQHKGKLEGLTLAYIGDGANNVANSLLLACALTGISIRIGAPPGLQPDEDYRRSAEELGRNTGAAVSVTEDPVAAVRDADIVYTDTWISMGQEAERQDRLRRLAPYQVNDELCASADSDFVFMHCLPQHIGEEVSASVAYGPHSVIFDQAENRLHMQKAIMLFLSQEGAHADG